MKAKLLAVAKLTITVFLFIYIFRRIDFGHFGDTLRNASFGTLLGGFCVLWIGHYTCIYRWRMLMRPLMPVQSLPRLLGIYCIGLFFNLTFPTVIGGDVVKMYYAGKPARSYAQSFAATFLDRDAGMFAMMIIACAGILYHRVTVPGIPVTLIIWGVFAAFVAGNAAIFTPYLHQRLIKLMHRLHFSKVALKVDMISNAFQIMGRQPAILISALLISLVNQLLVIAVTWIMALGLQLTIQPIWFLIFVPVITLISMIPISLNGMGLREYAFMSLFGAIGVPASACIALGLLSSAVIIISSMPGGIVYIFFRNQGDLKQLAAFETEFS
jgi:hypothetical protein